MADRPAFMTSGSAKGPVKATMSYCGASCGKDEVYHDLNSPVGGDNPKSSERPRDSSKGSFVWGMNGGKPA